jgi:tetratricopeptide (TPR) repeat protein
MSVTTIKDLPKKTQETFQKALSALERDNLDYAVDIFSSLVNLHPHFMEGREMLRMAEIKRLGGKKTSAVANALSYATGAGAVLTITSNLKKKPLKALKAAEELLKKNPLNKHFLDLQARAAEASEMPEAAIHSLKLAHETYPKDVAILTRLAEVYQHNEHTTEAKECFEKLVLMRPNDPKVLKAFKDASARETMDKGGWEDAEDYRGVLKNKEEAILLEQQAKSMKSEKDTDDLIAEHEARIEAEPDNLNIRRALAELYARSGRFEDALTVLYETQKMTGGGDPQIDRAITQVKNRQFEQRIEQALEAGDEARAEAIRKEQGDFIFADAEDRVRRYPNDLQIKFEYGVLLFERDKITDAIQQFQQAQRNPQRRIRALYYMALCFKSKKQYDIAAAQLEKAAEELSLMDDTKKDIVYELGLLYESMGQMDKAVVYFKQIYAVDIGYREVAHKIEQAYKAKQES